MKEKVISKTTGSGLKIVYDDVAPYAKDNSMPKIMDTGLRPHKGLYPKLGLYPRPTTTRREFPDLKRDDLNYPGYALCYPGFSILNGQYINMPEKYDDYGYISDEWSDASGMFGYSLKRSGLNPKTGLYPRTFLYPSGKQNLTMNQPTLTVTFNGKFSSVGILLTFNLLSGDYATDLNIKWYEDGSLLSSKDFEPDSNRYFCNNYVQNYNMIAITFKKTSKPYRPVFLTRIDYGIYRDFLYDELVTTDCIQEINAISENISINTLSFTVRTKSNIPFDLQKKQKLSVYFDNDLIGNFYLKNGARKNIYDYFMDAHDAIGVLDGNEYVGGIYTGELVKDVVAEIFAGEDFICSVDPELSDQPLYGYIPYTTKRNALVQIAFAIGAIVDTSNVEGVSIYPAGDSITGTFEAADTFDGITLERSDIVTGIRLTTHTYQPSDEQQEIYNEILSGTAEIVFSEPYHDFSATGGTILKSGANYVVISGTGEKVTIVGKKYIHNTSQILKENPDIVFNKNIKDVTDATLINAQNSEQAIERIYNYYMRAESVTGDVLLKEKVIGQRVEIDTGYDGKKTGVIESVDYSFGKAIKAKVTIHE